MPCKFKLCPLDTMADLSESVLWNLSLQPLKQYTSTIAMPMTTKLGRVVTYHDRYLPIKLHKPLITWSYDITGPTKIISTTRVPMAAKLG